MKIWPILYLWPILLYLLTIVGAATFGWLATGIAQEQPKVERFATVTFADGCEAKCRFTDDLTTDTGVIPNASIKSIRVGAVAGDKLVLQLVTDTGMRGVTVPQESRVSLSFPGAQGQSLFVLLASCRTIDLK